MTAFTLAQCLRKKKHSEPGATHKIEQVLMHKGKQLYKYKCPDCLYFHVTRHEYFNNTKNFTHIEDIVKAEPKVELHNLPPKKREYIDEEDVAIFCLNCNTHRMGIKYGEVRKYRIRCCACMKTYRPELLNKEEVTNA